MPAYLELVVCGPGARCALAVGERVPLPDAGRAVCAALLGAPDMTAALDGVIEAGAHGHVLSSMFSGVRLNDEIVAPAAEQVLRDGDLISPARELVLKYVVAGARFPVQLDALGPLLLFSRRPGRNASWRAVYRSSPASDPMRAVVAPIGIVIAVDDPAVPQLIESLEVAGKRVLLFDDTTGCTYGELIDATRAQAASLDHATACALFTPIARAMIAARTLTVHAGPERAAVLGFDGTVRFFGIEPALLPAGEPEQLDPVRAIAAMIIDATTARDGAPLPVRAHALPVIGAQLAAILTATSDVDVTATRMHALLRSWAATLGEGALPDQRDLSGLVRNVFADRARIEDDLRERLALLDERAIASLVPVLP